MILYERIMMNTTKNELITLFTMWKKTGSRNSGKESDLYPDNDYWGDKMESKNYNDIRISMENINNIGKNAEKNSKQDLARDWLIDNEIDIASWIEVGVAWNKLCYKDRLLR